MAEVGNVWVLSRNGRVMRATTSKAVAQNIVQTSASIWGQTVVEWVGRGDRFEANDIAGDTWALTYVVVED